MQIYINKNGQQIGPFDEAKVREMLKNGEVSADDWVFRQGDTEWSRVGTLYPISSLKIIRLTVKTGLEIGWVLSDYQPIGIIFLKVPTENIETFRSDYLEQFYDNFHGEGWRSGNSDGSQYRILDEKIELLSVADLAKAEWRQAGEKFFYLVKNGKLEKVELAEFEEPIIYVTKEVAPVAITVEPKNSDEANILETIEQYLNDEVSPQKLLRKLVEYERWKVPFTFTDEGLANGETPQLSIFEDDEGYRGLYIFTDTTHCSNYLAQGKKQSFITLGGVGIFGFELSDLDFLVINGNSETAITYAPEHFESLNEMSKTVGSERESIS